MTRMIRVDASRETHGRNLNGRALRGEGGDTALVAENSHDCTKGDLASR